MRRILKVLVLVALFTTYGFSVKTYGFSTSYAKVKEILELSGLNKQIANLPAMVEAGARQSRAKKPNKISDKEFNEVLIVMKKAFDPNVLLSAISKSVQKDISTKDANNLISWFKSKLGKKIVQEEIKASSPKSTQEMLQNAKQLLSDKSRVLLAFELDELTHSSQMQADLLLNMNLAMIEAFANPTNKESLKRQAMHQIGRIKTYTKQLAIVYFVYTYKNLSIADIKKYINFLKTPSAQKFNDSLIKSYRNEIDIAINNMARDLAKVKAKYKK